MNPLGRCIGLQPQALVMAALTSGSILIGFVFNLVLISKLGFAHQTDQYFLQQLVPQLFLTGFAGPLANVCMVEFVERTAATRAFAGGVVFVVLGGSFVWGAGALLLQLVANASQPNLSLALAVAAQTIPTALQAVLVNVANANQRIVLPDFLGLVVSVLALVVTPWSLDNHGILGFALVQLARLSLTVALMLTLFKSHLAFPDRAAWSAVFLTCRRATWMVRAAVVQKLDMPLERLLLSGVSVGAVSMMYFAQQVAQAVASTASKAVISARVPMLKAVSERPDRDVLIRKDTQAISRVAFALITVALLTLAVGWKTGILASKISPGFEAVFWICIAIYVVSVYFTLQKDYCFAYGLAVRSDRSISRIDMLGTLLGMIAKIFAGVLGLLVLFPVSTLLGAVVRFRLARDAMFASH